MAVTYYALLTTIGAGKLANATALGTTLKITQLAVGDGGGNVPTPDASRTQLVNEVRRAPLNRLSVDPANSAQIIAEQVIPEDVGGWWIREMGLYDEAGALIAYANCAPSYKPQLAEGSGRTQTVRIVLIVSNAASVELKIDPSVVLATREYVDNSIVMAINRLDCKQSVRAATTASITLSGLQTVDGIALATGDRVLVKSQSNAADNGIYLAGTTIWKRAADADENIEVTPGLTVVVENGVSQVDSIWQLITDGPIVLGSTPLIFQNITNGLAKLASPAFTGAPTAPTPSQFDLSTKLATTEFVQRSSGSFSGFSGYSSGPIALGTSQLGNQVNYYGATNSNLTLPRASVVPAGAGYWITNSGNATLSILLSGSDTFVGTSSAATLPVGVNDSIYVASAGTGSQWIVYGGSAQLKFTGSFGALLAQNGYQKLPSGLVIQWQRVAMTAPASDQEFALPSAFPMSGLFAVASFSSGLGAIAGRCGANLISRSTVRVSVAVPGLNGAQEVNILSLGF